MKVEEPQENYLSGWIKVFRSINNKYWYKNSKYVHLWVHLLLEANHADNEWLYKGKGYKVKRGQLITSRKSLSRDTGISQTTIERILDTFEKDGKIGQQNMFTSRLISINNYEIYQTVDSKRTANGQQTDTNNEYKNYKEVYVGFIEALNAALGKKYKGDNKSRISLKARLGEGYTVAQIVAAAKQAAKDEYHIRENLKYITPEFITRSDKLDKFLQGVEPEQKKETEMTPKELHDLKMKTDSKYFALYDAVQYHRYSMTKEMVADAKELGFLDENGKEVVHEWN